MGNLGTTTGVIMELVEIDTEMKTTRVMKEDEPSIYMVEVTAPSNVDDWIKDKLHALCGQLTDEEMAYSVVYISEELERSKEAGILDASEYEDDYDYDEEYED